MLSTACFLPRAGFEMIVGLLLKSGHLLLEFARLCIPSRQSGFCNYEIKGEKSGAGSCAGRPPVEGGRMTRVKYSDIGLQKVGPAWPHL